MPNLKSLYLSHINNGILTVNKQTFVNLRTLEKLTIVNSGIEEIQNGALCSLPLLHVSIDSYIIRNWFLKYTYPLVYYATVSIPMLIIHWKIGLKNFPGAKLLNQSANFSKSGIGDYGMHTGSFDNPWRVGQ